MLEPIVIARVSWTANWGLDYHSLHIIINSSLWYYDRTIIWYKETNSAQTLLFWLYYVSCRSFVRRRTPPNGSQYRQRLASFGVRTATAVEFAHRKYQFVWRVARLAGQLFGWRAFQIVWRIDVGETERPGAETHRRENFFEYWQTGHSCVTSCNVTYNVIQLWRSQD